MTGHGHVTPNPDGSKARCGGPGICAACSREAVFVNSMNVNTDSDAEERWHWVLQGRDSLPMIVNRDEWMAAEKAAGFHRTIPGEGPATQSWSGHGMSGWRILKLSGIDGHGIAAEQISKHGSDRYPTPVMQLNKLIAECTELMTEIAGDGGQVPQRIADEYADVGLSFFELGNKLGLNALDEMKRLVREDTRTFD
jgi:NTP pyrophosphatase (non-canonical NTP hydrolase)